MLLYVHLICVFDKFFYDTRFILNAALHNNRVATGQGNSSQGKVREFYKIIREIWNFIESRKFKKSQRNLRKVREI